MLVFDDFFVWRRFFGCFERQFGIISALAAVTSQQGLPGAFCDINKN